MTLNTIFSVVFSFWEYTTQKATLHTRLRVHDHCTSSTLIGGKGGAGPTLVHTVLEVPTEYVKCIMDVKSTWIPTRHISNGSFFMVT